MYMMIRQKLSKITDLNLLEFLLGRRSRDEFLTEYDLAFHEQEQVLGVGFQIRDRINKFLNTMEEAKDDKSIPFVLMMHQMAFPDSKASNRFEKLIEWSEKSDSKLFMATGIYFLNHFEGQVEAITAYNY